MEAEKADSGVVFKRAGIETGEKNSFLAGIASWSLCGKAKLKEKRAELGLEVFIKAGTAFLISYILSATIRGGEHAVR